MREVVACMALQRLLRGTWARTSSLPTPLRHAPTPHRRAVDQQRTRVAGDSRRHVVVTLRWGEVDDILDRLGGTVRTTRHGIAFPVEVVSLAYGRGYTRR